MKNNDWIKMHGSAIYLVLLLFFSIILFIISGLLDNSWDTLKAILNSLAGVGLTAFIASFFFSLPDMKIYLAEYLAALFTENRVVSLLNENKQNELRKRVLENKVNTTVSKINTDLYLYLDSICEYSVKSPIIQNLNYTLTVYDFEEAENYVLHDQSIMYRIYGNHLIHKIEEFINPVYLFPFDESLEYFKKHLEFRLKIDNELFGPEILEINQTNISEVKNILIRFKKEFKIEHHIDIDYRIKHLKKKTDNEAMIATRYPTRGFNFELRYKTNLDYNYWWFSLKNPKFDSLSEYVTIQNLPDGIKAIHNDWVLPGEGISAFWMEK